MFPATLGYSISGNKQLGGIASVLLVLGAVIRLAYFNVTEPYHKFRKYKGIKKQVCNFVKTLESFLQLRK